LGVKPLINETCAEKIDELFKQWDKPDSPGCALAIIKHGDIIYKKGYGMANLEYGIPITSQIKFQMGSISKQFTAFSILLLEKKGKLSLKDDIYLYLPDLPQFGKQITIQHLLNHTSGLRDERELIVMSGWRKDHVVTQRDVLYIIKQQKELNFEPGSEFLYSNTGYTLLAEIVATVSGMKFTEFTNLNIFKPLGMEQTSFRHSHRQVVKNCAYSYRFISRHETEKSILSFVTVGPRGLLSSAEDLSKWDENFYTGKVGGMGVINKLIQKGVLNDGMEIEYANGLGIMKYRGLPTIEHGGSNAGYHNFFLRFPDQQITIICFGNFEGFRATHTSFKIADIILERKLEKNFKGKIFTVKKKNSERNRWKISREKISPEKILDFTGKFFSNELSSICEIVKKGSRLIFNPPSGKPSKLFYLGNDIFRIWCKYDFYIILEEIKFTRDEQNIVKGFRISGMRVKNLKFERMV